VLLLISKYSAKYYDRISKHHIEKLLSSLDAPDSRIDAIWAKEADARVEAFERGELGSNSAEEVFKKYRTR